MVSISSSYLCKNVLYALISCQLSPKRCRHHQKQGEAQKVKKDLDTTIHIAVHSFQVALKAENPIIPRVEHCMVLSADYHDALEEKHVMVCAMEFYVLVTKCLKVSWNRTPPAHTLVCHYIHSPQQRYRTRQISLIWRVHWLTTHLTQKNNYSVPEWQKSQLIHKQNHICASQGLK